MPLGFIRRHPHFFGPLLAASVALLAMGVSLLLAA